MEIISLTERYRVGLRYVYLVSYDQFVDVGMHHSIPVTLLVGLKQESNHRLWSEFGQYLRYFYWYDKLLWTRGYFVSSIGNASAETIQAYIDAQ